MKFGLIGILLKLLEKFLRFPSLHFLLLVDFIAFRM